MLTIQNYINGNLVAPLKGDYVDNFNPATGERYSLIPDSDHKDIENAVTAAKAAYPSWSALSTAARSTYLLKIANLIDANLEELTLAETNDNGKPLWLSKSVDIPRASSNFRFYATAILHSSSESHSMGDTALNYTLREPIGIAGCISPWNLPLYLFSWKIAPALATGNCVIAKPSEVTPMTAFLLSKLCIEAGLPAGVLNIVHGLGAKAGAAICAHPEIPIISFTGGTKTGADIARVAAPMFKKLSLELGGKNPNIIFGDCDFDQAVKTSVNSSFTNQGQICLCGSRIFVEEAIYDKFLEAFITRSKRMIVGDPLMADSKLGAVVSEQHLQKILDYVDIAKAEGGEILLGGNAIQLDGRCSKGWFMEPTIIAGLDAYCRINQEEIFGPVVSIMPFKNEAEVLGYANATRYGLSATIWTENLTKAHRVAAALKSGIVWINCWLLRDLRTPFGGMKDSGVGREGGWEALKFFTEAKNVCVKL